MKIVVLDAYTTNPGDLDWNILRELGDLTIYDRTNYEQTIIRAQDADVIFTNKVVLDANILRALPKLRFIGILATGTNIVDLSLAKTLGIVVSNVPGYSTESVVQNTFAHILNLATYLSVNVHDVHTGVWSTNQDFSFSHGRISELFGKQLGIIGFGTIGSRVAQIAHTFGMRVVAYGPHLTINNELNGTRFVSLDDLFKNSDIISLHCPLTPETCGLINTQRILEMKFGTWLINTARGLLVDEQAVAEALRFGQIGGAGLDVLSTEPPQATNPLLSAPNCFITPHNAWASYESRKRLIQISAENLIAFINNTPQNVVNY